MQAVDESSSLEEKSVAQEGLLADKHTSFENESRRRRKGYPEGGHGAYQFFRIGKRSELGSDCWERLTPVRLPGGSWTLSLEKKEEEENNKGKGIQTGNKMNRERRKGKLKLYNKLHRGSAGRAIVLHQKKASVSVGKKKREKKKAGGERGKNST